MSTVALRSSASRAFRWLRLAGILAALVGVTIVGYWVLQSRGEGTVQDEAEAVAAPRGFVSAIGRLEPASRVVELAAPMAMEPARIERLGVKEGDWVEEGAMLALLDTNARRKAAVQEAEARITVAQARLAQVKAGAKPGEIAAQEAVVRRDEASLKNAETEWQRTDTLATSGAVTKSERDQRRTAWETAQRTLDASRATLAALKEVRDVDVQYAEAELAAAQAALQKAKSDVDATELRAPFAARVLRIHARPGEKVGEKGVFEIADTAKMQAVAEVYEGDIGLVRVGQTAIVRIPTIDLEMMGQVEEIGNLIGRKDVFDNDPVADTDARVVEVRIGLKPEDAQRVERLTNLRIEIRIDISGSGSAGVSDAAKPASAPRDKA